MRNLMILAFMAITTITSCRYATCTEPTINLEYKLAHNTDSIIFNFKRYSIGSGFSGLVDSVQDTAYYNYDNRVWANRHTIEKGWDYIIDIPETNKTYKIEQIQYDGKKRVQAAGLWSEMRTACTRNIRYTVNGLESTLDGSTYEKPGRPINGWPTITITK